MGLTNQPSPAALAALLNPRWISSVGHILEVLRDTGRLSPPLDPIMAEIIEAVEAAYSAIPMCDGPNSHAEYQSLLDTAGRMADRIAELQASSAIPSPTPDVLMMPRVMALVGGVLMLCDEIERTAPGFPLIDGKRLRDMAIEVRDSWAIPSPTPEPSGPSEKAIDAARDALKHRAANDSASFRLVEALEAAYAVDFGATRLASTPEGPWRIYPHGEGLKWWWVQFGDEEQRALVVNSEAEALAVRDALNAVASRVATGKGEPHD